MTIFLKDKQAGPHYRDGSIPPESENPTFLMPRLSCYTAIEGTTS